MPGSLPRRLQRRGGIWLGREARHQLRPYPHRARRVGALGFETRHSVIGPELVGELFEGLAPYLFGFRLSLKTGKSVGRFYHWPPGSRERPPHPLGPPQRLVPIRPGARDSDVPVRRPLVIREQRQRFAEDLVRPVKHPRVTEGLAGFVPTTRILREIDPARIPQLGGAGPFLGVAGRLGRGKPRGLGLFA